jgi:hypothetical protein
MRFRVINDFNELGPGLCLIQSKSILEGKEDQLCVFDLFAEKNEHFVILLYKTDFNTFTCFYKGKIKTIMFTKICLEQKSIKQLLSL